MSEASRADDVVRVDAEIRGRVQGVGFRYFVLETALGLDLRGWVANTPTGSVRCVAEGPRASLERLVELLREGPFGARVDSASVEWTSAAGSFDQFSVRSLAHPGD